MSNEVYEQMSITKFVNDKDLGGSKIINPTPEQYEPPTYEGQTTLTVEFEFYAENRSDDPDQVSEVYASVFDAVDAARRIAKETGRPAQVRIDLQVDDEGRYMEQEFVCD
jgi:hypothetical protein